MNFNLLLVALPSLNFCLCAKLGSGVRFSQAITVENTTYAHVTSAFSRTDFAGPEHFSIGNKAWKEIHDRKVWHSWVDDTSRVMSDLLDAWFPTLMRANELRNVSIGSNARIQEAPPEAPKASFSFGAWIALSGDFYISKLNGFPETDANVLFNRLMSPGEDDFIQLEPGYVVYDILKKKDWMEFKKKIHGSVDRLVRYLAEQAARGEREGKIDGSIARNFWQFWLDWDRYKELAETNFNHFGDIAELEYKQIHELAKTTARRARSSALLALREKKKEEEKDPLESFKDPLDPDRDLLLDARNNLELALQVEGLALHYLTDRFAGGHIRVPRTQLQAVCHSTFVKYVKNIPITAPLGGFLSKLMHDADGDGGLWVSYDGETEPWQAFGDGEYFNEQNKPNRERVLHAVKNSVLDVIAEFFVVSRVTRASIRKAIKFPQAVPDQKMKPMFYYDKSVGVDYKRGLHGAAYGIIKSNLSPQGDWPEDRVAFIMPTIEECKSAKEQSAALGKLKCTGCAEIRKYFDKDENDKNGIAFV